VKHEKIIVLIITLLLWITSKSNAQIYAEGKNINVLDLAPLSTLTKKRLANHIARRFLVKNQI
jgi:hypothetical protein